MKAFDKKKQKNGGGLNTYGTFHVLDAQEEELEMLPITQTHFSGFLFRSV